MVRLPGSEILLIIAAEDMGIPTPAVLALTRSPSRQCTPKATIVSSSRSTDGSTLRVKLRIKKERSPPFISSANNVNIVMENLMLPPSIQGSSWQSPWTPSLDTIAETDNLLGDL